MGRFRIAVAVGLGALLLGSCGDDAYRALTAPGAAQFSKTANAAIAQTLIDEINANISCLYAGDPKERTKKLNDFRLIVSLNNRTPAEAEAKKAHVNNFVRDAERYVSRTETATACGGKSMAVASQELFNKLYLLSDQPEKVETPEYTTDAEVVVCMPGVDCEEQTEGGATVDVPAGTFDVPVIISIVKVEDSESFDYTPFNVHGTPVPPPYHFDVTPNIAANGDGWGRYICVADDEADPDDGILQLFRRDSAGVAQAIPQGNSSGIVCPEDSFAGIGNPMLRGAARLASRMVAPLRPKLLYALQHRVIGGPDILASPHVVVRLAGTANVSTFCPGGPAGTFADLQAAVDNTAPDGTVEVCDGEYNADSVIIDKPLTVRSANAGQATLGDEAGNVCCQGGLHPVFIIRGVSSGLVRFENINFKVYQSAILAGNSNSTAEAWDQIEIDNVGFVGRDTITSYPVRTFPSTVAGAKLAVTNSRFTDVFIGVFAISGEANIRNSTFTHAERGIVYSFPNLAPTTASTGTAENNTFDWCGLGGCIRVLGRGGVLVKGNTVQALIGPPRQPGGIHVQLLANAPGLPVVVEDNTVTGARIPATPPDSNGWTIRDGVTLVSNQQGAHLLTARRNTISQTHVGVVMSVNGGASAEAHDNTISNSGYGMRHSGSGAGKFRRNDVVNTFDSFEPTGLNPATGPQDYTCNWWGSTSGPTNPPTQYSPSVYTPWALQPVANNPGVTCTAPPPQPDLVISAPPTLMVTPTTVAPGGSITLSNWTVKNQGNAPSGGFSSGFYLSPANVPVTTTSVYLDGNSNTGLPAGGTFSWGGPTLTIPPSTAHGNYHVGIIVDNGNTVAESNEANNIKVVPLTVGPPPAVIGSWTATGSPAFAHRNTPAVPLPDGRVFISGQPSEIYTPATGAFTSAGNTIYSHGEGVTLTVLANGEVLIVGGNGAPTSAEKFNPGTGAYTAVGSLAAPHEFHSATRLQDGTVLIAGGQSGSPPVSTPAAELFDPTLGIFSPVGPLNVARTLPASVLLPNGKVLILGGTVTTSPGFGSTTATAELYDPLLGTFSPTGSMITPRTPWWTGVRLLANGRVLVVGAGSAAELYDVASGTFSPTGVLPSDHGVPSTALLADGRVLVAGGHSAGATINKAAVYNPATGTFAPAANMTTARQQFPLVLLPDGRVLAINGLSIGTNQTLISAERFSP